jgi:hypothetical protein
MANARGMIGASPSGRQVAVLRIVIVAVVLATWETVSASGLLFRDVVPSLVAIGKAIGGLLVSPDFYGNLGITATEAGSDWVIPHVDIVNQSGSVGKCVPVPLYNLVYHDAVIISYGAGRSGGEKNLLLGILCGGVPELPVASDTSEETLTLIRKMAALNKRVALLEMTGHQFLDANRGSERTTFEDGTTVTVDWNAKSVQIRPDLNER